MFNSHNTAPRLHFLDRDGKGPDIFLVNGHQMTKGRAYHIEYAGADPQLSHLFMFDGPEETQNDVVVSIRVRRSQGGRSWGSKTTISAASISTVTDWGIAEPVESI